MDVTENSLITGLKNIEEKCDDNFQEPNSPTDKDENKFSNSSGKVDLLFKATGNAPIMKTKKWKVSSNKTIGGITTFLRNYLKLSPAESLFLYVNQAFAPAPDQIIKNLYECYGAEGKSGTVDDRVFIKNLQNVQLFKKINRMALGNIKESRSETEIDMFSFSNK